MGDLNLVIAGAAGQGVQSAAAILAQTLMRMGFEIHVIQDYQSRVRGGHNFMQIRFSDKALRAAVRRVDFLLALNEESLRLHLPRLVDEGLALCMEADRGDVSDPRLRSLDLSIGPPQAKSAKFVGVKLLSMLFTILDFPPDALRRAIESRFGKKLKPEVLQANLDAVDAVAASVVSQDVHPLPFAPDPTSTPMLVSGNDAVALGMVAAGLGVYTGYPMTPSTSLLNALAGFGPQVGIAVEQVEDEIAAIHAAIGASYAGARAATGSSGAGMALMSEAVGLAGITETPVVIFDGQRSSPAVGMATRTEQGDLLFLVHSSQGEFPRAVLAPADHDDAFYLCTEAFNIADRWQLPVFFMSDLVFADTQCSMPPFDLERVTIDRGELAPEPDEPTLLRRYEVTDSGVSPRAFPALSKWIVACDSHEHDEVGHLTDDIDNRNRQHAKRMRKLQGMASQFPGPQIIGAPADVLLCCWGSTTGPLLEASERLRRAGHKIAVAVFRYLFPMDAEKIRPALQGYRAVYTVEGNYTGQLGRLLRMETGFRTDGHIGKYDGRPFFVEDIVEAVERKLESAQ